MKNIIIAQEQGKAVAVGDNSFATVKKTAEGNFLPSLSILNSILDTIPTESGETVHIYLPDMIQAIVSGSAIEYVKTGKTGSGNPLTAEEIAGFKTFYNLYAGRVLNVRFSIAKYIKKDNTALIALRNNAWNTVKNWSVAGTVTQTTVVDPNAELKAMIDKQILEALTTGNMEMVTNLTTYKNSLPAPTVVTSNTSTTSNYVAIPKFEDEADTEFNKNDEAINDDDNIEALDDNGNPIVFDEVTDGESQPAW